MSTLSLRQRSIRIGQARCRIDDAKWRAEDALHTMQKATTAAEYGESMRAIRKAADEIQNWKIVLRALER